MDIKKVRLWVLQVVCLFMGVLFISCGPNTRQIIRMQALEEGVGNPTTIPELQEAIRRYQHRIEDIVQADVRTGLWYKILATRYLDNKMYKEALENFRMAIEYFPDNQNLYYYVGVCAGYMAKASLDYNATGDALTRQRYYALSESAYKRAIELEPRYSRALYGLAILYVFELERSAEAIPLLELVLDIEKRHIDAMFVLARAWFMLNEDEKAIELYDRIQSVSTDARRRAEAAENKQMVLDQLYAR